MVLVILRNKCPILPITPEEWMRYSCLLPENRQQFSGMPGWRLPCQYYYWTHYILQESNFFAIWRNSAIFRAYLGGHWVLYKSSEKMSWGGTSGTTWPMEMLHLPKFGDFYEGIDGKLFNTVFLRQMTINFKLIMCKATFGGVYWSKLCISAHSPFVQLDPC